MNAVYCVHCYVRVLVHSSERKIFAVTTAVDARFLVENQNSLCDFQRFSDLIFKIVISYVLQDTERLNGITFVVELHV